MAQTNQSFATSGGDNGFVETANIGGGGRYVLVCEHASNFIPDELSNLGLSDDALNSHIAWDPGARAVCLEMAKLLDGAMVAPRVSRLVFDCNRPVDAESAILAKSEIYDIPGNVGVDEKERNRRADIYYHPFGKALSGAIDQKSSNNSAMALITIHSFTPVYQGVGRSVDIGIIHDSDSELADELLKSSKNQEGLVFARNEPYGPKDGVTFTLREHGTSRGIPNVMVEIKNSLLVDEANQKKIATMLAVMITEAVDAICKRRSPDNFPCCSTGN